MVSDQKEKFGWSKGQVLNDDNSKPLGGIRLKAKQDNRIEAAPLAEPKARVELRQKHLNETQSQVYSEQLQTRKQHAQEADKPILIIEESQSGVTADYEPSQAKKLGDEAEKEKEHQFQGVGRRFGSPNDNKK